MVPGGAVHGEAMRVGQRVVVYVGGSRLDRHEIVGGALGTVRRPLMSEPAAWVDLDERQTDDRLHPFPADDVRRARHTLAYPDDVSTVRER